MEKYNDTIAQASDLVGQMPATPPKPEFEEPMNLGFLLKGIQRMDNIYGGTADPYKVAKRHAKNKVAKQSRKANRKR